MMTITTSQYRNLRQFCRLSTGHGAACFDRQLGPPSKTRLQIRALPFGHYDPPSHRIATDPCAQAIRHNSHTASVAPKSP